MATLPLNAWEAFEQATDTGVTFAKLRALTGSDLPRERLVEVIDQVVASRAGVDEIRKAVKSAREKNVEANGNGSADGDA